MRPASPPRSTRAAATPRAVAAATPHPLHTLRDLPPSARVLLLDQFGVLHDGRAPYSGAIDAVRKLAKKHTLIVLSNSSRRADHALDKLHALGFDRSWFAGGAVTSGEVAHARLAARPDAWWRELGTRVLHITWGARGAVSLEGLGLELADAATADFILAHGTEAVALPDGSLKSATLEDLKTVLRAAAAARTPPPPFLCANPDLVTVDGGALRVMPGTLAAFYEAEYGGRAVLLGKPGPEIYAAALARVGDPPPSACLAVGDSLEHDVAGAAGAGIDCLYIAGGIHGKELGVAAPPTDGTAPPPVDADALAALLAGRPPAQVPRYVKPYLAP